MISLAHVIWSTNRASELNEFEQVYKSIGKVGKGTRHARQQINQAYVLMLSGQFQGFCRDLHSEAIDHLARYVQPLAMQPLLKTEFQFGRKLDTGNPNAGNIGNDFNRLGLEFWKEVLKHNPSLDVHKKAIDAMNEWRNAVAHQSFDPSRLGGTRVLRNAHVTAWRKSCDALAQGFDSVVGEHLKRITGSGW